MPFENDPFPNPPGNLPCRGKNQTPMKRNLTPMKISWRKISLIVCGTFLLTSAGCICINVNVAPPGTVVVHQPPVIIGEPPPGGNFTPVQAPMSSAGTNSICGQPVSTKYFRFAAQTPPTGTLGWVGYLVQSNTVTHLTQTVPSAQYIMQWAVTTQNTGCATNVSGSTINVGFSVNTTLTHRWIAHWKQTPPASTVMILYGSWVP